MKKQALTDFAIRNIPSPNAGQCEIWDTRIPGFGVRVSHGGSKAFVLLYRFNGRPRRMTLGRYPTLSLADARVMAHEASRAAALGSDPGMEKIKARQIPAVNDLTASLISTSKHMRGRRTAASTKLFACCGENLSVPGVAVRSAKLNATISPSSWTGSCELAN